MSTPTGARPISPSPLCSWLLRRWHCSAIAELAAATVLLLLLVFTVVNGALFVLKGRKGEQPGYFEIPRIIPALGALVCMALIVVRVGSGDWEAPAIAGVLLAGAVAICLLLRPKTQAAARAP
jgi:amino acid transporter